MNWEEYLDPWLRDRVNKYTQESLPPSDPVIRAPQYSDYPQDNLRSGTWWEAAKDFVTDIYPGRSTMDYLATGQPSTGIVGDLAGDLAGPIGKLGAAAKGLPALAGMVKLGGKEFPEAFLHRTIMTGMGKGAEGVDEFQYLQKILDKGASSEKPMSLVAPNYPYTFRSGDIGLIFNANEGDIKKIWPRDAATSMKKNAILEQVDLPEYEHLRNAKADLSEDAPWTLGQMYHRFLRDRLWDAQLAKRQGQEISDKAIDGMNYGRSHWMDDTLRKRKVSKQGIIDAILRRDELKRDIIPNADIFTETWDSALPIGKTQQDADLFKLFEDAIPFHRRKEFPEFINHNEAIGRYSGDNLAGIRISPDAQPENIDEALKFAENNDLPIYSWSSKGLTPRKWLYDVKKLINTQNLGSWKTKEDPFFNTGKEIIYPDKRWGWPKKTRTLSPEDRTTIDIDPALWEEFGAFD